MSYDKVVVRTGWPKPEIKESRLATLKAKTQYRSGIWAARTRGWCKTLHFAAVPATRWTRPALLAFLPSTGVAVTLSSGLSIGLRWRRVLTFVKHQGLHSSLTIRRWAGRGLFAHGTEVIEAWEEVASGTQD